MTRAASRRALNVRNGRVPRSEAKGNRNSAEEREGQEIVHQDAGNLGHQAQSCRTRNAERNDAFWRSLASNVERPEHPVADGLLPPRTISRRFGQALAHLGRELVANREVRPARGAKPSVEELRDGDSSREYRQSVCPSSSQHWRVLPSKEGPSGCGDDDPAISQNVPIGVQNGRSTPIASDRRHSASFGPHTAGSFLCQAQFRVQPGGEVCLSANAEPAELLMVGIGDDNRGGIAFPAGNTSSPERERHSTNTVRISRAEHINRLRTLQSPRAPPPRQSSAMHPPGGESPAP